jgi:formylmethanofuran dehydrogenase subunit D
MQKNENNLPRYTANVSEILEDGSAVLDLPQELLDETGWTEGTDLIVEERNGTIVLYRKDNDKTGYASDKILPV